MIVAIVLSLVLGQGITDSALDARTREVASTLRCPACEDVSIEDSPADLARDMRKLVRQQLAAGRTPAQVRGYFADRYGAWVLLDPAVTPGTSPLWLLPLVGVAAAGAGLTFALRRWTRADGGAVNVEVGADVDTRGESDELEVDRLEGKISEEDFQRLRGSQARASIAHHPAEPRAVVERVKKSAPPRRHERRGR